MWGVAVQAVACEVTFQCGHHGGQVLVGCSIVEHEGKYHLFFANASGGITAIGDGHIQRATADHIEGPYTSRESIALGEGPMALKQQLANGTVKYALFFSVDGHPNPPIMVADNPAGPWTRLNYNNRTARVDGSHFDPAPVWYNNTWYLTDQATKTFWKSDSIYGPWVVLGHYNKVLDMEIEDPFLWIDKRGHFHVVNHAMIQAEHDDCINSKVSHHAFSVDGVQWQAMEPYVAPWGHVVKYEDGTSRMFTTLERPNIHFDQNGSMTHMTFAADSDTGITKCPERAFQPGTWCNAYVGKMNVTYCPCNNCKWDDPADTIILRIADNP